MLLVGRQEGKNMERWGAGVVICLERGARDLHMVQLMPLLLRHLCFRKSRMVILVPAYPGSPGKKAVKRMCVFVCLFVCLVCLDGWMYLETPD